MTPEDFLAYGAGELRKHNRKSAGEGEIANAPEAKSNHRIANGGHVSSLTE
jgi:hypothetical protein